MGKNMDMARTITAGTPETRTEHSVGLAIVGLMISMGLPAAVAIIGIAALGWNEIHWLGAIVWGMVATFAFTSFGMMGRAMGMTRMDLLDLLGSTVAWPHTTASRAVGAMIHHVNGALLSVAWAYGVALVDLPANWATAVAWSIILWMLALLMMTTMGAVHPAIRKGTQDDPGTAATNFGKMTPLGSLLGHIVYGVVLGLTYQTWPLS